MVLYVEKTLKTSIQKNLSKSHKFVKKISVVDFFKVKPFYAVHSNFTYDLEACYPMKLYFETLLDILISSLLFLDRLRCSPLGHCNTFHVDIVKQFIPNIKFLECNSADISLP